MCAGLLSCPCPCPVTCATRGLDCHLCCPCKWQTTIHKAMLGRGECRTLALNRTSGSLNSSCSSVSYPASQPLPEAIATHVLHPLGFSGVSSLFVPEIPVSLSLPPSLLSFFFPPPTLVVYWNLNSGPCPLVVKCSTLEPCLQPPAPLLSSVFQIGSPAFHLHLSQTATFLPLPSK
jgi:hypothetical protein